MLPNMKKFILRKKKLLESISPHLQVIGKITGSFEVKLDETLIWSKLGQSEQLSDESQFFPSDDFLLTEVKKILALKTTTVTTSSLSTSQSTTLSSDEKLITKETSTTSSVSSTSLSSTSTSSSSSPSSGETSPTIRVFIEYCTNCGYKTIYLEKKRIMEDISPLIHIIGNATIPRLAAFEVTLEDGTIIWSKLGQRGGKNNDVDVFPSNEHLSKELRKIIGNDKSKSSMGEKGEKEGEDEGEKGRKKEKSIEKRGAIYRDGGTEIGVW